MAGGAFVPSDPAAAKAHGNPIKNGFITRPYLWAFSLTTSLFFLWGFAYGLLDVLNKHFRKYSTASIAWALLLTHRLETEKTLNITKLQSTGLQVAYFGVGYFAYSPVAVSSQ